MVSSLQAVLWGWCSLMGNVPGPSIAPGWLKLVPAARLIGVYPGSLNRWWSHGIMPESVAVKYDGVLYFHRDNLLAFERPVNGRPRHG